MDRVTAKEEIKNKEPDFLKPAKQKVNGHISYICPVCGNGSGSSGTGIALDPHGKGGKRYKCFKCGLNEDVIGLWKIHTGQTDDKEAFNSLYEHYGLQVDSKPTAQEDFSKSTKTNPKMDDTQGNIHTATYTQGDAPNNMDMAREPYRVDFTEIIETAHRELLGNKQALDYLQGRGLSMDMIKAYKLGYDELGYNHFLRNYPAHQCKSRKARLYKYVFPYPDTEGKHGYFLTEISDRKEIDEYNGKYRKISKGETDLEAQIFNERYLENPPSVLFVCEGIYDALSVEEAGGKAIAFIGTAHRRFLALCKRHRPKTTFVISLDNDSAGSMAIERVKEGLDALEIPYIVRTAEQGKDFNEALLQDREVFTEYIQRVTGEALRKTEEDLEAQKEEYLKTSTASHLQEFIDGIADSVNTPYIPTGFPLLDEILDGGLYEGLYILGAISSLGKTTLALQIADQIAETGQDILIFSLEMARAELMAKSISRLTALDTLQNNGDVRDAKTTRGITTGTRYQRYSKREKDLIQRAIRAYGDYAGNIYIHEGIGDIGTDQIRETIEKHILFTGKKPTVLIDYVQILAPADIRATDKQNTDKAVLELKRMSRDFKIPVIGISSFNRANYKEAVTMEAFKESGSLEYGSDVLIGLQLAGAGRKNFDANEAKQKNPRDIQLVILKNRNGATGKKVCYEYYPLFNYFKEMNIAPPVK